MKAGTIKAKILGWERGGEIKMIQGKYVKIAKGVNENTPDWVREKAKGAMKRE